MLIRAIALAEVTAGDRCGGKAAALGAMTRAGLPVPDGFALGHDVFAMVSGLRADLALDELGHAFAEIERGPLAIPAALDGDVRERAAALGRLAVRSSMSLEDARGGAGAGVFASHVDVAPADVWSAVRAVWASALSPLAIAYARRRGDAAIEVGAIVQRFEPGARVTIYTRPPGAPARDEVWIEASIDRAGETSRVARTSGDPRVVLALRAEAAIGAREGADVELIERAGETFVVQARPIVHPAPRAREVPPAALFAFTRATPGVTWRWDAAHNPSPLSPAQAGLVERVDAAGVAPYRLHVVAGYLYTTASSGAPDEPSTDAASLRAKVEGALARATAVLSPTDLAGALAAYVAFYAIWSREAGPPIAATRRALAHDVPADDPAWRPRGTITARLAAGDHDALRALAPAWDVAAPTADESPGWLDDATRLAATRAAIAHEHPADRKRALAAAVAELAEADDLAFARAQACMRRAILAEAARRRLDPDDAFWLPLDELADPGRTIDPISARARAAAARAAATRAARWTMPLAVTDGEPAPIAPMRGSGFGGRAAGRAIVLADLAAASAIPPGAIVVVPAVLPALALFAQAAAAIVAEHGGALDHGAALARELGVPYVITPDARELATGDAVVVDGDAGTVTRQ